MLLIFDENFSVVNTYQSEHDEQELASRFIEPNDVVLELGARYGSVSCVINKKLYDGTKHVAVEPDSRVWEALEYNKKYHNCSFQIVKGVISKEDLTLVNTSFGYGTTSMPSSLIPDGAIVSTGSEACAKKYSIDDFGLDFNVLVADCEGFLGTFIDENLSLLDRLRMVLFEADYPEKCDYDRIRSLLTERGFKPVVSGFQNAYIKESS